jgi:cysteinyl-tRNA synthetase
MSLVLYNTLTRKKEVFKPIKGKEVKMFVCGPTVYDYSHLGHAKTYVQFDVIARYFKFRGYKLFYLENITDIDDRIISRAAAENLDWKKIRDKYEWAFLEDMKALNINSVDKYARATNYVENIISQVKRLIKKGYAYKISDGWYFDLKKDKSYGKLSGRKKLKKDDSISRIDENKEKRNFGDFCLWKFSKPGEPIWKSDIGDGRPGWHIEDTAITEKEFGIQYDLHGGGIDLVFPHHEAEIAQMESISGKKPMVKYWLHTGFLKINKSKMSKSLGNFKTIREILKIYSPEVIRYFIISNHYRKPLDFSEGALENAKNSYNRLKNLCGELSQNEKINNDYLKKFEKEMDDNFNTPNALQILWKLLRDEKAEGKLKTIEKMDKVLGLNLLKKEKVEVPADIKALANEREDLRKKKKWKEADEIRNKINKLGYILEDTKRGAIVKKR